MNITEKAKKIADSCRFCWMCRHVCPVGNATGQERNTARARALAVSLVSRGAEKIDEIIDNVYECTLCGACTNNCVTGWDPKVFIQEVKTDAALNGVIPAYVNDMLDKYEKTGNVYGESVKEEIKVLLNKEKTDILFFAGSDAIYKSPESVITASNLLKKAGVKFTIDGKVIDSGNAMWFLTGKTEETLTAAKNAAAEMNGYKTVIVYDPVDLKLIRHEYKEWGIEVTATVKGFNEYVKELVESGKLKVKNGGREYTLQDNYAYARDLDDETTAREIIAKVGVNKEMLLKGKEANFAGSLIMNEYMPDVQTRIARDRWVNAANMGCRTIVTENPAEYEMLKKTAPEGYEVKTVEQIVTENLI